jgi:hypothetical protein
MEFASATLVMKTRPNLPKKGEFARELLNRAQGNKIVFHRNYTTVLPPLFKDTPRSKHSLLSCVPGEAEGNSVEQILHALIGDQ